MKTLVLALAAAALGGSPTTWAPKEFACPACDTRNTFQVIVSYGSYIYSWPSKYQYLFWPLTDENVLYSCKKCRLSALMGDFEKTPKDKLEAIREKLKGIELPEKDEYFKIPMSRRLAAAERVYEAIGKDDEFWSLFFRTKGYHLEAEKLADDAKAARRKALEHALKVLEKKENAGRRKELLLVTGAMRDLTGDAEGARKDLEEALKTKFQAGDKEKSEGMNEYLDEVLREYVAALKEGRRPGQEK